MDFYNKIQAACREQKMSITELTEKLGISKSNIRNWKNGVLPKFQIRLKIAELTEIPLHDILTPEELAIYKSVRKE